MFVGPPTANLTGGARIQLNDVVIVGEILHVSFFLSKYTD